MPKKPRPKMVDVRISRIVMRDNVDQQWIYLSERAGKRGFHIVIGSNEAREIHRVVTHDSTERPLTHQLAYAVIEALGAKIERVDITDLRNNTFFAKLVLAENGHSVTLDARPSDALALGLRAGCPIRVAESVLEEVRADESGPDPLPDVEPDEDEGDADEDEAGEANEEEGDDD